MPIIMMFFERNTLQKWAGIVLTGEDFDTLIGSCYQLSMPGEKLKPSNKLRGYVSNLWLTGQHILTEKTSTKKNSIISI